MSTPVRVLIVTVGGFVGIGIAIAAVLILLSPTEPVSTALPTPETTAASAAAPEQPETNASATAAASPEFAEATCENISTDQWQESMLGNDWVSWQTQDGEMGWHPFDEFPGGAPEGQIICAWGQGPEVATDDVQTLAWAPIDSDTAARAQQMLADGRYERIEADEGVYLASRGEQFADEDGYGQTYLFTDDDVRWAWTKQNTSEITAPPRE